MKRIPSLDGLRAISVSLVLLGHLARAGRIAPHFLFVYALTGVRMFFVISGYLITTILLNEHRRSSTINLREFYIRRAYRILPAAGVFMFVATVVFWHELRWLDIAAMFLYLMNYDAAWPWMVAHLWSLGVEEQFYFLWPSVLRKFYSRKTVLLVAILVVSPVFVALCRYFRLPSVVYASFPAVADNLAGGCLLAIVGARMPRIRGWLASLLLVAVVLIPHYVPASRLGVLLQILVLGPATIASMAGILLHVVQTPYRILNIAPVVWLGKISYSLYLWQQPFTLQRGRPAYTALFGLGLACLSYYLVEQPVLALREKRAARLSSGGAVAVRTPSSA